jgi:hypothetical protein
MVAAAAAGSKKQGLEEAKIDLANTAEKT